jgi:hypothetical protein
MKLEEIDLTHYTLDRLPRLAVAFCSVLRHLLGSLSWRDIREVQNMAMGINKPKGCMQDEQTLGQTKLPKGGKMNNVASGPCGPKSYSGSCFS